MSRICDNCGDDYTATRYHKTALGSVRLSENVNMSIHLELLGNVDICAECLQRVIVTCESEARNILQRFIDKEVK